MRFHHFFICIILSFLAASFIDPIEGEELIKEDIPYLVDLYKSIHQSPEISLEEKETSEKLALELEKVGFEVTRNYGGYGIVGILKNGEGPMILYRTDMDALPMYEKTDLPYSSKKEIMYFGQTTGTMHSCGHDMHMATWVGTARALANMKDQWSGTLMMIGQPAEEIGAGSKLMLDNGLYADFGVPDYGLALHCNPTIPVGQIGVDAGYSMANTESVDIKVYGIGAHGASPHMSVDPVVLSSMIVMELQTIVSRNIKPIDDAVITVGAIQGGIKHNIIPDEVTLKLTIRTYTQEVRQLVHKRIEEICRGLAISAGLPEDKMPTIHIPDTYTPANYNDPALTERLIASASNVIGSDNVIKAEPQMVGEDFSNFGQTEHNVPTVLFWLGTIDKSKLEQESDLPGLHSPFYFPLPEESLLTGVQVTTNTILDLMD